MEAAGARVAHALAYDMHAASGEHDDGPERTITNPPPQAAATVQPHAAACPTCFNVGGPCVLMVVDVAAATTRDANGAVVPAPPAPPPALAPAAPSVAACGAPPPLPPVVDSARPTPFTAAAPRSANVLTTRRASIACGRRLRNMSTG